MWIDTLKQYLQQQQTGKAVALTSDSLQIGMNEAAVLVDKIKDDGSRERK